MDEEEVLKKARNMVLRLLTFRARSRKEVYDYLERKGFSENVSAAIVKEMEGYGYINDEQFAEEFIVGRKLRGHGIKKVRYELYMKGIDNQIVDQKVNEHFDPDQDLARIKELLEQRMARRAGIDEPEEERERLLRREAAFLKRRGFQDHLIMKALKDLDPPG